MALHRGPGNAERARCLGDLELPPALLQQVLEQRVEPVDVPKAEQPLNVARKERIEPLAIQSRLLRLGQQRRRKAAVKQAPGQRRPECC